MQEREKMSEPHKNYKIYIDRNLALHQHCEKARHKQSRLNSTSQKNYPNANQYSFLNSIQFISMNFIHIKLRHFIFWVKDPTIIEGQIIVRLAPLRQHLVTLGRKNS